MIAPDTDETLDKLNDDIESQERTVQNTPETDRSCSLSRLQILYQKRFEKTNSLDDLDASIKALRELVNYSKNEVSKGSYSYRLGYWLHRRFDITASLHDLNAAIDAKKEAVNLLPKSNPARPNVLFTCAYSLQKRYERTKSIDDLEAAISLVTETLGSTSEVDPERIDRLRCLTDCLIFRFEISGSFSDLNSLIDAITSLVFATPAEHPYRGIYVEKLYEALGVLANFTTRVKDWDGAIKAHERQLEWCQTESDRALALHHLADALRLRFESTANAEDLDRSIEVGKESLKYGQNVPVRAEFWNELAVGLFTRHTRFGPVGDIDAAISACEAACNLATDSQRKATFLINLGAMLMTRFRLLNSISDINAAIEAEREALSLAQNSLKRVQSLNRLGFNLGKRFQITHLTDDLDSGVKFIEEALEIGSGASDRVEGWYLLSNYTYLLTLRFEERGNINDLKSAIRVGREAISISPDGRDKGITMRGLSTALQLLFDREGSLSDLDEAIDMRKKILDLIPSSKQDHTGDLSQLGLYLLSRYKATERVEDLDEAIRLQTESVQEDQGNPSRARWLNNLAMSLFERFARTGSKTDLNSSIEAFSDAAESPHLQGEAGISNNLANALRNRFHQQGSLEDLNAAITSGQKAVELTPIGHVDRPMYLTSLANAYCDRFERKGNRDDLDAAVQLSRDAVEAIPKGHPARAKYLANLSSTLIARFKGIESLDDLDAAISILKEAIDSINESPSARAIILNALAESLITRYRRSHVLDDLAAAIDSAESSIMLTRSDSATLASSLLYLGTAFLLRFKTSLANEDLRRAMTEYERAALIEVASVPTRIKAARNAGDLYTLVDPKKASRLLNLAVELLPSTISRSSSWSDREYNLSPFSGLTSHATASAIRCNSDPVQIVRLLDYGRCIIYGQQLDSRTELKGLPDDLAVRYANLQNLLNPPYQSDSTVSQPRNLHKAALNFEALLEEIRSIPEHRYFGRPLPESTIFQQASAGPLVMLNVNRLRCDALIVTANGITIRHLSKLSWDELNRQVEIFRNSIEKITSRGQVDIVEDEMQHEVTLSSVLEWLWDTIAEDILNELGHLEPPTEGSSWPRMWWCPTGTISFLPIHAAGYHNDLASPRRTVLDRVVSSYTASIRSLMFARAGQLDASNSMSQKTLVVTMPTTENRARLPLAREEAARVRQILWHKPGLETPVVKVRPTPQELYDALPGTTIAHFVCHAEADELDPSASALLLKDGALSVAQISRMNLRGGALAYLSACRTALSRVSKLEDEVITLTNGFQMAGFSRIVGTLWNAVDRIAFEVAEQFYVALGGDVSKSAYALHQAVREQRKKYRSKPSWWASYIYTGT